MTIWYTYIGRGEKMPVLVLLGNSELSKEKRVQELKTEFGGSYIKIHPEDGNKFEVIQSSLNNIGMFGERQIIDIVDYDSWKAKEKKELEKLLKNISDDVLVVIRSTKVVKGFKAEKHELPKPWERDKWISYLKSKFEEKGLKPNKEVLELFLDFTGMDEYRIENEIEKIRLYVEKEMVTADDIEKVVYRSTTPAIDELLFFISEKRYEDAHKLVSEVLKHHDKIVVTASLVKHFIELFRVKATVPVKDFYRWPDVSNYSKNLNIPVPKIARFLGFKFSGWKNVPYNHIKNYSIEELANIIKKLYLLDRAVKMGESPEGAFHEFIEYVRSGSGV